MSTVSLYIEQPSYNVGLHTCCIKGNLTLGANLSKADQKQVQKNINIMCYIGNWLASGSDVCCLLFVSLQIIPNINFSYSMKHFVLVESSLSGSITKYLSIYIYFLSRQHKQCVDSIYSVYLLFNNNNNKNKIFI